jgi:hypothetical protein
MTLDSLTVASGLFPDNTVMFPMRSWCLVSIRFNKFSYLADMHFSPKAEVTGSNPVGCANEDLAAVFSIMLDRI